MANTNYTLVGYEIYQDDEYVDTTTALTFTINELQNGRTYEFGVRAVYANPPGYSELVTEKATLLPFSPIPSLSVALDGDDIRLVWGPVGPQPVESFNVYRMIMDVEDAEYVLLDKIDVRDYTDEDVAKDTRYRYQVIVEYDDPVGFSRPTVSNPIIVPIFNPPLNLTASQDLDSIIELKWDEPEKQNYGTVVEYEIYSVEYGAARIYYGTDKSVPYGRSDDDPDPIPTPIISELIDKSPTTEYTVKNLDNHQDYDFYVVAVWGGNITGKSEPSNTVTGRTEDELIPPVDLVAVLDGYNVVLTWKTPTRAIQGYNVYRNGDLLNDEDEPIKVLTYTDIAPAQNVELTYGVTIVYDSGESEAATIKITVETLKPATDLVLSLNKDKTAVILNWKAPAITADMNMKIESYRIIKEASNTSQQFAWDITDGTTTYIDKSVQPDVRYYYRVWVKYENVLQYSLPIEGYIVVSVFNPISNLDLDLQDEGVIITWNAPAPTTWSNPVGYDVYRDEEKINEERINTFPTRYIDDTAIPGAEHEYGIVAVFENPDGESVMITDTILIDAFAPVENLVATISEPVAPISDWHIILTWDAPKTLTFLDLEPSSYIVYRSVNKEIDFEDDDFEVFDIEETTFTETANPDKFYYYAVVAVYEEEEYEGFSVPVFEKILYPAFNPVTNLVAAISDRHIVLTWDPPAPQTNGTVKEYIIDRNDWSETERINAFPTEFVDKDAEPDTEYTYTVIAVYENPKGQSEPEEVTIIFAQFSPVTNFVAAISDRLQIDLSWEAPEPQNFGTLTGFEIFRDDLDEPFFVGNALIRSVSDKTVEFGIEYTYTIFALYEAPDGQSIGMEAKITPVDFLPITNLVAAISDRHPVLTWEPPAKQENITLLHYVIRSSADDEERINAFPTFTDENATPDAKYEYSVTAVYENPNGESEALTSDLILLPAYNPPLNLFARSGDGVVYLSWDPPLEQKYGMVTEYHLYRDTISVPPISDQHIVIVISDQQDLSYEDITVVNETTYVYYVIAYYKDVEEDGFPEGYSLPSDYSFEVTPGVLRFNPPTAFEATLGYEYVILSWGAPQGGSDGTLVGYELYMDEDEEPLFETDELSIRVDDLENGEEYTFGIKAIYEDFDGESALVEITVKMASFAPVAKIDVSLKDDMIHVEWDAITTQTVEGYDLYVSIDDNDYELVDTIVGEGAKLSYTTEAELDTMYQYKIVVVYTEPDGVSEPAYSEAIIVPMFNPALNLVAERNEDNSVTLEWDMPEATKYSELIGFDLYREVRRELIYLFRIIGEAPYTDKTAVLDAVNTYSLVAVYETGFSEPVNTEILIPIYNAPENLVSVNGLDSVIFITWEAPDTQNYGEVIGYNIYRDGVIIFHSPFTILHYIDEEVENNSEYEYYVTAVYEFEDEELDGESLPSNTIRAYTADDIVMPSELTLVKDGNDVVLTWKAPVAAISDRHHDRTDEMVIGDHRYDRTAHRAFLGYNIYRNDEMLQENYLDTTYTDIDTPKDMLYVYSVTTNYDSGESEPIEAEILLPVYNPPLNLEAVSGLDSIVELTWEEPEPQTYGELIRYNIYRDEELIDHSPISILEYTDIDLENAVDYEYYITAVYEFEGYEELDGESLESNIEIGRPEDDIQKPVNLVAELIDNEIHLSWELPTVRNGLMRSLQGYNIYRNDEILEKNYPDTTYIDTDIELDTKYEYSVTAVYSSGESEKETVSFIVPIYNPVTNLVAALVSDISDHHITLTWDAPIEQNYGTVKHYLISVGNALMRSVSDHIVTDTEFSHEAELDTFYTYNVIVVYEGDIEGDSEPVSTEILVPSYNPPLNLIAVSGLDSIVELTWEAPEPQTYGTLIGYNIYRDEELIDHSPFPILEYTDIELENAVDYEYYITAVYEFEGYEELDGESLPSNTVTGRPEDNILMPENLVVVYFDNEIHLSWDPVGNAFSRSVSDPTVGNGLMRSLQGYKITRNDIILETNHTETTYVDSFVDLDNLYAYSVTAVYSSGESDPISAEILLPVYNPPLELAVVNGLDSIVELTWEEPEPQTYGTLIGYNIYRDGVITLDSPISTLEYIDSELENAVYYEYYITAVYEFEGYEELDGESLESNTVTGRPEDNILMPANLVVVYFDNEIHLSWDPVGNAFSRSVSDPTVRNGLMRSLQGYKITRNNIILETNHTETTYIDSFIDLDNLYEYSVTAVYSSGESDPISAEILLPVYNPPLELAVVNGLDSIVELTWEAPEPQTYGTLIGYNIYRDEELIDHSPISFLEYTDSELENAVDYEYYITAVYEFEGYEDLDDESLPSNTVTGTPEDNILMPANLVVVYFDNEIHLSWDPVGNAFSRSVSDPTVRNGLMRSLQGYKITRNNIILETNHTETSYVDSFINLDNLYEYSVSAVYSSGESDPISAEILLPIYNPPLSLAATDGLDTIVELTWSAPEPQTYGTLKGYNIYRDGVNIFHSPFSIRHYVDSGLNNATNYEYYITAVYEFEGYPEFNKESIASNTEIGRPEDNILKPINVTAVLQGGNNVVLTWEAPVGNALIRSENNQRSTQNGAAQILYGTDKSVPYDRSSRALTGYNIYRNGVFIFHSPISILQYVDLNLQADAQYVYGVSAIYDSGESDQEYTSIIVPIFNPPLNLSAISGLDSMVVLNWLTPLPKDFGTLLGYSLYRDGELIEEDIPATQHTFIDTGLTNATNYEYFVISVWGGAITGKSLPSNTVIGRPEDNLLMPNNLVAVLDNNNVVLTWDAPEMAIGDRRYDRTADLRSAHRSSRAFLGYNVFRNSVKLNETPLNALTYTDITPQIDAQHTYAVSAIYDSGESDLLTTSIIIPVYNPPMYLTAVNGLNAMVTLQWQVPNPQTFGTIMGYNIYRDGAFIFNSPSSILHYTDTGLQNATNYQYYVTVVWGGNIEQQESVPSNTVTGRPEDNIQKPENLIAALSGNNVVLTWDAPNYGGNGISLLKVPSLTKRDVGISYENDVIAASIRGFLGYNVYRDNVKMNTTLINVLTYTDNNPQADVQYIYGVTAVYDSGESEQIQTPFVVHTFNAPVNLVASIGDGFISLNWTAPATQNFGTLTGYILYRDGVSIFHSPFSILHYQDNDVVYYENYEYKVTALYVNPEGESLPSNTVTASTVENMLPPTNGNYQQLGYNVILTWSAPQSTYLGFMIKRNGVEIVEFLSETTYVDTDLEAGQHQYEIFAVYIADFSDPLIINADVVSENNLVELPTVTKLVNNYPNPFNPTTNIHFQMAEKNHVTIEIFNVRGQKVKTLVNETLDAGDYTVTWNGNDDQNRNVSSGMYLYIMKTGEYVESKRMTLMK